MELWNDLVKRGVSAVTELKNESVGESQQLEFKRKQKPDRIDLDSDDKKNFGRALSAFSNATGGIVIWGIGTSDREDEKVASDLAPIADARRFAQMLEGLVPQYLSPPNLDVRLLPIAEPNGDGYVAVRIGTSDARPHMSTAPGHHTYYLRVGATTLPMVDFQVRDMLRIKTAPKLGVAYSFTLRSSTGGMRRVYMALSVYNDGKVSARHAYLLAKHFSGAEFREIAGNSNPFRYADSGWLGYEAAAIIHPGLVIPLVNLQFDVQHDNKRQTCIRFGSDGGFQRIEDTTGLTIEIRVGCEDLSAREIKVELSNVDLENIADHFLKGSSRPIGGRV